MNSWPPTMTPSMWYLVVLSVVALGVCMFVLWLGLWTGWDATVAPYTDEDECGDHWEGGDPA